MNLRAITTVLLLAGCIGLLQYHAIQFWAANVDAATGWVWSLLLEGAALWLWFSPTRARRALGAVATLLLLAGPLYQVSAPLIHEWQASDASAARRADLNAEITHLEAALNGYVANSAQRVGWAQRIDATQARLDAARAERAALTTAVAAERMSWQRQAIIGMQAFAICLFQLLGVLAIGELRRAAQEQAQQAKEPRRPVRTDRPSLAVIKNPLRGVTA